MKSKQIQIEQKYITQKWLDYLTGGRVQSESEAEILARKRGDKWKDGNTRHPTHLENFQNYDQHFDKNFENFKKFEKENQFDSTGFSSGYDTRQSFKSDERQAKKNSDRSNSARQANLGNSTNPAFPPKKVFGPEWMAKKNNHQKTTGSQSRNVQNQPQQEVMKQPYKLALNSVGLENLGQKTQHQNEFSKFENLSLRSDITTNRVRRHQFKTAEKMLIDDCEEMLSEEEAHYDANELRTLAAKSRKHKSSFQRD